MSGRRKFLCLSGGLFTRNAVFQTADALEIDSTQSYEISRRRVFYEEVMLVTYHSERGFWYLLVAAVVGALFTAMGVFLASLGTAGVVASMFFFLFGVPADVMFVFHLVFGRDVITVFGRRSKAVLRFSGMRRRRAREVYGQICAAVRKAQAAAAAPEPAPVAEPLPEGVPMPPE